MRFRFCGDLDCPDWVLAEISILAKISSVKLKLICAQVLKEQLGEAIDYEKILKLTSDARFGRGDILLGDSWKVPRNRITESGDIKATVAVLCFILSSAAKHNVSGDNLSSELQQLGLPREHAASLCRSYEEKQTALQEMLRENSLRLSRLSSLSWRVDQTLSSSVLRELNEPVVHLNLCVKDSANSRPVNITMSASKLRVLLTELKQAFEMMNSLN
ncbi:COMM domain-containing protein 4 isoform X2 [Dendrobates tinctorius]|uniref:COMM domain-containing protein 4 isoform X2 n=1 Tax=Dendrobates tinctorius TaxID=92724 RepID=UPI003CC962E3